MGTASRLVKMECRQRESDLVSFGCLASSGTRVSRM